METIAPKEAFRRASEDAACAIVDIREDFERSERIPGAVTLPMSRILREADGLLDKKELYFICASGGRSLMAAEFLASRGHEHARSVYGGILAWSGEGLPLVSREGQ